MREFKALLADARAEAVRLGDRCEQLEVIVDHVEHWALSDPDL